MGKKNETAGTMRRRSGRDRCGALENFVGYCDATIRLVEDQLQTPQSAIESLKRRIENLNIELKELKK